MLALYIDLLDTLSDGALNDEILTWTGGNLAWVGLALNHLPPVILDDLLDNVSLTGQRLDFAWVGTRADTQIQLPIPTGAQIVSRLAALTGNARLSYGHLRDVPAIPTLRDQAQTIALIGAPTTAKAGLVPALPTSQAGRFLAASGAFAAVRSGIDVVAVNNDTELAAAQTITLHTPVIRVETAFTSANSNIPSGQRSLQVGDIFFWDASNGQWERIVHAARLGGLTASQATALIAPWARAAPVGQVPAGSLSATTIRGLLAALSGAARLPYSAISGTPAIPTLRTAVQTRDLLDGLSGSNRLGIAAINVGGTAAQVLLGNGALAALPIGLPAGGSAGQILGRTSSGYAWIAAPSGGSGGITLTQAQAAARALIADWAETGNASTIPQAKLAAASLVNLLSGLSGANRLSLGALRDVPPDASQSELNSGTQTQIRAFSPADIAEMAELHGRFTSIDERKLDGIAAGAQVNVKPDWNAAAGTAQEILNRPGDASQSAKGIVELATPAEAITGTDHLRALTPQALAGVVPRMTTANRSTDADTLRVLTRSATDETASWAEIDLGPAASPSGHSMDRYIGISTTTSIATAALTTGATSTSDTDDTFNAPTWASGTRYLFFAVPSSTADIVRVNQTGAALGDVPVMRASHLDFTLNSAGFKVWRTEDAWPQGLSGASLTIDQG